MIRAKIERLQEFQRRIERASECDSFDEGMNLIIKILNEVEDEMSGVPYDPSAWEHDGRMYPPQEDSIYPVEGYPEVRRLRSRFHNTFIALLRQDEIAKNCGHAGRTVATRESLRRYRRQ